MTSAAMSRPAEPLHEPIPLEAIQSGAARHFTVSVAAKAGTQLLRLGTMLVLARLLVPADFGVLAMVMSALGIAELLRDLGLSQATVRAAEVTHGQVNTLFWINATLGVLLAGLCVLAAPWLGALLADPRVGGVAAAMGATFLLNGLASQHMALLRRRLRFAAIARVNIAAALGGSIVALALAALGAAYWALVAAALTTSAINAFGVWISSGWRPSRPAYDPSVRPMMSFGGYLIVFGFLTYLGHNAHIALIGRMFGASAAGLYLRASMLITQPLSYALDPLRLIMPASLARLQSQAEALRAHYLGTLAQLLLAAAPLGLWLALTADDVVHLLFGARWEGTGSVLSLLALSLVPQVLNSTTGWLYLASGNARDLARWGAVGWSVVIAAMLLGLRWGINGVAAMYSLSMFLILVPCLHYARRGTSVMLGDVWSRTWRPCAGALLAALPLWAKLRLSADWLPVLRLALGTAVFAASYLVLMMRAFGEGERLMSLYAALRAKLRRTRGAQ
jgi:O-antigen/teichoic acid export membrane protein